MTRWSQHNESTQPPAGQAPLIAATVISGERYSRARNTFWVTQNSLYLSHDVRGAYSSMISLPAVKMSFSRPEQKMTPRTLRTQCKPLGYYSSHSSWNEGGMQQSPKSLSTGVLAPNKQCPGLRNVENGKAVLLEADRKILLFSHVLKN